MPAAASTSLVPYGRAQIIKMKGTSSYPTGGYDLPPSQNGTAILNSTTPPLGLNDGQANFPLVASGKVKFIVAATGAEVASTTDMSGVTLSILVR